MYKKIKRLHLCYVFFTIKKERGESGEDVWAEEHMTVGGGEGSLAPSRQTDQSHLYKESLTSC